MKLGTKLFASYMVVILIGLVVLSASMTAIAPANFERFMMGRGHMGGMMGERLQEIEVAFQQALNNALLLAGLAAVAAATLTSWFITRRVTQPLRQMAHASHRIAAGHYEERLVSYDETDELGDLVRSFNQMAAALAATEQTRQQLIADVSHELKTPLASIKGYMEGLQDGIIDPTPETYQLIHHEATRLQRLVEQMQELSRAEADQLSMEMQPCDAVELARSAVDWLAPQFDEKSVTLHTDLPEPPVPFTADFDRIRQVLLNLLGNALQYSDPGSTVTVTVKPGKDRILFSVVDEGVGLAPVDQERIFQRFYRVDKSRARASGGSGIGLTIAQHIVEDHGGRIHAESAGVGQGSTFTFWLPVG